MLYRVNVLVCVCLSQDVVIQMLQYYPSLLTSQAPPPLTDAEFSRLPSLTICREALGACISSL